MTSLWKMPVTQISKLKAGSFVEAGTGIPLNSESPSHGLTFHPPGTVAVGAGRSASGHWHSCSLRRTLRLAVRDCQGLWAGTRDQGPAPGWARAGASPWSRYHHRIGALLVLRSGPQRRDHHDDPGRCGPGPARCHCQWAQCQWALTSPGCRPAPSTPAGSRGLSGQGQVRSGQVYYSAEV